MKLLNLVRERESENWSTTDLFLVEDSIDNEEEALRNAIEDYLKTREGKKSIKKSSFKFNWEDAVTDVPNKFLNKYGIYRLIDETKTITVNQDEILFPKMQESVLNEEKINIDAVATRAISLCKEVATKNSGYKRAPICTFITNDVLFQKIMHLFDDQAIYDLINKIIENEDVESVEVRISSTNDETDEIEELMVKLLFSE